MKTYSTDLTDNQLQVIKKIINAQEETSSPRHNGCDTLHNQDRAPMTYWVKEKFGRVVEVVLRSCLKMVPAFYYAEFSRQFRLWKRERSSSYVTDDKDENGRKGRIRKKRNYF